MLFIFIFEWIVDSNWFQNVCQFNTLPSNSFITSFGSLHFIYSVSFEIFSKLSVLIGVSFFSINFSSIAAINSNTLHHFSLNSLKDRFQPPIDQEVQKSRRLTF